MRLVKHLSYCPNLHLFSFCTQLPYHLHPKASSLQRLQHVCKRNQPCPVSHNAKLMLTRVMVGTHRAWSLLQLGLGGPRGNLAVLVMNTEEERLATLARLGPVYADWRKLRVCTHTSRAECALGC